MNKFVYDREGWGKDDPKEIVVKQIPLNARVLDIGCGVGGLGKWLKKNLRAYVVGLDGHPEAVKKASKSLDEAYKVDFDDLSALKKNLQGEKYDIITFIDVLEHCRFPEEILKLCQKNLKKNGKIIVSLPNIAHYSVRLSLLKGNFNYTDSGLLDRTHVRFYTKKTAAELLTSSGLKILQTFDTSPKSGKGYWLSKVDRSLSAVQFVMVAEPA